MKSKVFGVSLGSFIFILFLVAAIALVRPVYLCVEAALTDLETSLTKKLEEETGLRLSYRSLSPSIFIGANLRNVTVSEVATKNTLVTIKRASLSYSVTGFFSKNPAVALKKLVLNGVTVEYDAMKDFEFVEKIKKLIQEEKTEGADSFQNVLEAKKGSEISVGEREVKIPLDVIVKNLSVHYSDSKNDLLLTLRTLKFASFDFSSGLGINTAGKVFYKTSLFEKNGKWASLACNFSVSGKLFPALEGSSALVSLSGSGGADYSVSRLDMLVNYSDNRVEVRTMRTVLPFNVFARYDFSDGSVFASGSFDRFNPFRLVTVRKKTPLIEKFDGTKISGSLSAGIGKKSLSYKSNISILASEKLFGKPVSIALKCSGDKESLKIDRFSALGDFVDAVFEGGFNIKKMQPYGTLSLNHFVLANGGIISTEVFVDPYKNGFTCVSPQIFMNEKAFTGVQFTVLPGNKSLDFQFEALDFAHADFEETGRIRIDGSFMTGNEKFVQASVALSNIFADSINDSLAFFLPAEKKEMMSGISSYLRPYVFNSEIYFWSDFKNFSMNAPVCLLANTEKERELVSFAFDGSKETLQFTSFDLLFGSQSAHAELAIEFADTFREFSFTSDLNVNSVPYHFFGNFTPEWIAISGDYNFDSLISIDEHIGATLQFSQMPFSVGKYTFAASTSSLVHWSRDAGFEMDIVSLDLDEPSQFLHFNPHLSLSGTMNKYGFELTSFAYSDNSSTLDGAGSIIVNMNEGIFDSLHASLSAENPLTSERISLLADLSNPSQLEFSGEAVKNDFYISVDASVNSFPSSRLLDFQNPENSISAELTVTGTLNNPFVTARLHDSSLLLYGYPLLLEGTFAIDDSGLHVDDVSMDWSFAKISGLNAFLESGSFKGKASFDFDAKFMKKTIHAPFKIKAEGEDTEKRFGIPDYYSVTLSSEKVTGDFITSDFPLKLIAMHSPGRFDIVTDVSDGFSASYDSMDSKISVRAGKKSPVQFNLEGSVLQNRLDIDITGISADMGFLCSEIEIPFVSFDAGRLTGNLKITGPTTDPEYTGYFSVTNPNFIIPFVSKNYFHSDEVVMNVAHGEAVVPPTPAVLGKGWGMVEYRMEFNRWVPNFLELKIDIDNDHKVPLDLSFPFIHAKGLASGNLNLSYTLPRDLSISGYVVADDTDVEVVATPLQQQFSLDTLNLASLLPSVPVEEGEGLNVLVDFDIVVGQRVQLLVNPILRGVVEPGTPLSVHLDSSSGEFGFKSDIKLRGGEISWLKRNFYMKEGRIVFNENQDSVDPRVTVRAETRARDDNGNLVTITLSANNQLVSAFNPVFSSNPAKSEREIMLLLGQIISADSGGGAELMGAGGDLFLNSTVMRRIENTLRELLHFDIVSIRANVLQNSLKLGMDENSSNKQLTVGNFLDNSTVYVGKYFGSSIYVDSMLHWSYDEHKERTGDAVGGLVFQPEFGFEVASPFVNIRLGVAPDIDSLQKGLLDTWVQSTSMTLSWKFSF